MPNHGGARKGAGRPPTTHSRSTPIVSFRLGAEGYGRLKELRERPNMLAKEIMESWLSLEHSLAIGDLRRALKFISALAALTRPDGVDPLPDDWFDRKRP